MIFLLFPLAGISQEINPDNFVPLEVGNRWTYDHSYSNKGYTNSRLYRFGPDLSELEKEAYFTPFEIEGYPYGTVPPDSLLEMHRILTIEITHSEMIDGVRYFVFSKAPYSWPPIPPFFWAGKKVRLSDKGELVFYWEGREVSWYSFHPGYHLVAFEYEKYPASAFGYDRVEIHAGGFTTREAYFVGDFPHHFFSGYWASYFWRRFGLSICTVNYPANIHNGEPLLENTLSPISARISGEQIIAIEVDPEINPPMEPTGLGTVENIFASEGLDFSKGGTEHVAETDIAEYGKYDDIPGHIDVILIEPPFHGSLEFYTETGLTDLGVVSLNSLIAEGIPTDLHPDITTGFMKIGYGHTYAVWTREEDLALVYILGSKSRLSPRSTTFNSLWIEWVYFPDYSDGDTSVQSISWGRVKANNKRSVGNSNHKD